MIAYTGIETISNMAEEAKDEAHDDPGGDQPRAHRRLRDLLHAARGRAVGAAGDRARRRVPDAAGAHRGGGRLRRRPDARRRQADGPGRLQSARRALRGLLAATILFVATNAGIIGVSRLVYSMGHPPPDARRAAAAAPALSARRGSGSSCSPASRSVALAAGSGRLPRRDLRVRRDALVHDGARVAGPAARQAAGHRSALSRARATSRSAATTCRCSRSSAARRRRSRSS